MTFFMFFSFNFLRFIAIEMKCCPINNVNVYHIYFKLCLNRNTYVNEKSQQGNKNEKM